MLGVFTDREGVAAWPEVAPAATPTSPLHHKGAGTRGHRFAGHPGKSPREAVQLRCEPVRAPAGRRSAASPVAARRWAGHSKSGYHLQVQVRDNNVDQALRVLKKRLQREGVFREMKLRKYYEKPSEKRVREAAESVRRARKAARKTAIREGLIAGPKRPQRNDSRNPRPPSQVNAQN